MFLACGNIVDKTDSPYPQRSQHSELILTPTFLLDVGLIQCLQFMGYYCTRQRFSMTASLWNIDESN